MIDFFYNFVVYKKDTQVMSQYNEIPQVSRYTILDDHEYDEKSFSFVASRLVLAERVMLFDKTQITHAVVFEHEPGKLFDADTVTHTLLPARFVYQSLPIALPGARLGRSIDVFHGLQWKRNSRIGKPLQGYFPGCVGPEDAWNPTRGPNSRGAILLDTQGALATRCWPFFANQLAAMPQIKDDFSIDRFGELKQFEPATGGRKLSHVSDMARIRMRHVKFLPHKFYTNGIMYRAHDRMFAALREYHLRMNTYNHRWGDGQLPPAGAAYQQFYRLASIWYPLMKMFGYQVDDSVHGGLAAEWNQGNWYGRPAPIGVRWKSHGRQIDSCLRMLFNCHQWLKYYWGFGKPANPSGYIYFWWRSQQWPNSTLLYQAVYDDWDNITALYFKILDCINVLSEIMLINEVAPARGVAGPWVYTKPSRTKKTTKSYPSAVPFEPMIEVLPFPREPFLTTPPPPATEEAVPVAEDIPWDSGPPGESWDDEDSDDWAAQMREGVRVALAKLEFVRRWIGKIRKQMIWYRAMPIEKLAPQNDESQNPFDD
jgi:hypothetical protein